MCAIAAWLFDTYGVRAGALVMSGAMVLATGLNCLPVPTHWHGLTTIAASCLAGVACAPWNLAPALISATWFPLHQRTLATALMLQLAVLGWMAVFVLPPALVPVAAPAPLQQTRIERQLYGE